MTDYTKATVHTDALDTLGSIIGPEEKRDAIHLAVFPVEAGETLYPGAHVELGEDGLAYKTQPGKGIGIVDPFLPNQRVLADERFWLVVYPRQITSLRHVWEHPAFPPSGETATEGLLIDSLESVKKEKAEKWLRSFAASADVPGYEDMISVTSRALREGDSYVSFGEDAGGEIPSEYWDHLSVFTGIPLPAGYQRPDYFSCTC